MNAKALTLWVCAVGLSLFQPDWARSQEGEADPPQDYKPLTISEDDLSRLRSEFLEYVNNRRKEGRPDKARDREKIPGDLSFDDILNKAAQYHADRMALHEDETGTESSSHDGDDLGSPAHMKTPVDRIRHFGWPKNEMNFPGSGAEANAGPAKGAKQLTGALFAKGWMDSSTHYRPFFAYKLNKIGDHDYDLVGFGVSKTKSGGYYACAIFGVSTKPAVKLTEEELNAFPDQVLAEINKARSDKGLNPLAFDEELVNSAKALASKMAEEKRSLKDDEIADSKFKGGYAYSSKFGASIKDAKAALEGELGDDSGFLVEKMTHFGFAISLDTDGVPYLGFYWGHPS